jgi:hypothetical protein
MARPRIQHRINIDHALVDHHLLGAALGDPTSWSVWLAVLRAAFALRMSNEDERLFTEVAGQRDLPHQRVRELWAIVGRRAGKSRIAAALAVYQACFLKHQLARGEVGYVLVLEPSQPQATVVFNYALAFLQTSPVLRQEVESVTAHEIRLKNGLVIAVHPNSFRSVRGRTLVAVIFDEVAFWRSEDSALPDYETYRAVLPAS